MTNGNEFMRLALRLALDSSQSGGGPFAAVIVKDGQVIAAESNKVTQTNDPTAHAEVTAIRAATKKIASFDLSGCDIYTSCEPCPMCLGAIYWAHLDRIFYAATREDAALAGFDDSYIYEQIAIHPLNRSIPAHPLLTDEASLPFDHWRNQENKIPY
jgi:guanine deaminase